MSILNKNVPALAAALEVAINQAPTAYIAFKLLQLRRKLLAIDADLQAAGSKPTAPRVLEFERLRIACAEQLADKDAAGRPVIEKQVFHTAGGQPIEQPGYRLTPENQALFKAEMDRVEPEYHADILADAQARADFAALLEKPVEEATLPAADVYKIKIKLFDKLPPAVVADLYEIISEE